MLTSFDLFRITLPQSWSAHKGEQLAHRMAGGIKALAHAERFHCNFTQQFNGYLVCVLTICHASAHHVQAQISDQYLAVVGNKSPQAHLVGLLTHPALPVNGSL